MGGGRGGFGDNDEEEEEEEEEGVVRRPSPTRHFPPEGAEEGGGGGGAGPAPREHGAIMRRGAGRGTEPPAIAALRGPASVSHLSHLQGGLELPGAIRTLPVGGGGGPAAGDARPSGAEAEASPGNRSHPSRSSSVDTNATSPVEGLEAYRSSLFKVPPRPHGTD
jgi:hypothetical protein